MLNAVLMSINQNVSVSQDSSETLMTIDLAVNRLNVTRTTIVPRIRSALSTSVKLRAEFQILVWNLLSVFLKIVRSPI